MLNSPYMKETAVGPSRRTLIKGLKIFVKTILCFLILSIGLTIFYRFVPVAYTPLMFWRSIGSAFTEEKIVKMEKKWVPIEQISKPMQLAVIKAEDYKFYQHYGFDFEAIEKAIQYNKTHKKKKGASTISQQTAKNVFLWPSRSWLRKGLEAYFTVLIETLWPKKRILEVYLNVIEQASGVYGVEASAQKFFKKPASKINQSQAALMAAVLPNPLRFKIDKPSSYITRRQRRIMGTKLPANTVTKIEVKTELRPIETPEEKSRQFFSLKFDSENDDYTGKEKVDDAEKNSLPENNEDNSND